MTSRERVPGRPATGATRREVLKACALGAFGMAAPGLGSRAMAGRAGDDRSVILLMLVGGPSQLDSFDPKPDAPSEVRGPFETIATAVPGVRVAEGLPELARRMGRVALIRSMHHDEAPIHETGQQLIQTGRLCRLEREAPHLGSLAALRLGARGTAPPSVLVPGPIANTGVSISHGQGAGLLGSELEPVELNPSTAGDRAEEAYGPTSFGRSCRAACRLVESGARVVTVNMYRTVFEEPTWDCHGTRPFGTLADYRDAVLPAFDRVYAALLDDLDRRGLLETTLVVATGEFGRTPWLNPAGGRDHWTGAWTALLAGGGVAGGRVIGSTDARGAEPAERPVRPEELTATMLHHLGIEPCETLVLDDGTTYTPVEHARPIAEAFA